MIWMTAAEFTTLANNYSNAVKATSGTKGKTSSQKSVLDQLDEQMNKGVGKIKKWLDDKFPVNPKAEYSRYGLEHKKNRWVLPKDREKRLIVLDLVIANISIDGFDKQADYGLAFWNKFKNDYIAALYKASTISQTGHNTMGDKKELSKKVEEVLKFLLMIIEGNYREKYYSVALSMGYRKTGQ